MTPWAPHSGVAIALTVIPALVLGPFQLSRPGQLSGFTQYDEAPKFGDAPRLVHGAIAHRDFAIMRNQP